MCNMGNPFLTQFYSIMINVLSYFSSRNTVYKETKILLLDTSKLIRPNILYFPQKNTTKHSLYEWRVLFLLRNYVEF